MSVEIKVPALGESVSSATVARWMKQAGEAVAADEPLVELETDKVTVEVPAPAAGVLEAIVAKDGTEVEVGAVLGTIAEGAAAAAKPAAPAAEAAAPAEAALARAAARPPLPAAAKLMADAGLKPEAVSGTGKGGQITKGDVLKVIEGGAAPAAKPEPAPAPKPAAAAKHAPAPAARPPAAPGERRVERVRMTRLRATIARRLKEAQNTAAILTTFNEIDMSAVMALRATYRDAFEKRHGVRLGFMGFFVKACVAALREFPNVNAFIEGEEIVQHHYMDIGIAVSGPTGLVVPVLRNAETLSLAAIEAAIAEFGRKARDGALTLEEMSGGTFSITNGGVFGSLLSTPILNPPQSAILGMHKIEERPVAIGGKVEVRPMMYVALSYDHRIIDGREAVSTLVRIKEAVEAPERLLLEV
ncbi:2-oxoglutarate dehydrogenase complex dihydrolipoyllysine-residue succinyltransferase [Elioraea tepidiphila]|jgi:2-oxoglutarate dehydrogenase E2 component (dihydrolipoamide succinyltransferase)|uniref:2-oxoglutarate dehydrogenase complex dihydrolipoyllysine-residue succinyltransferase n=1 Tax=Elioraea tepidiphila TaxID=457934 RepID=UPI0003770754|nr:2-oxoglutarate dehydrogenase complex dihydrolipoyllysine-residue succinyltransferase [Elioraea tepidiphila]